MPDGLPLAVLVVAAAYAVGAVPFALFVARWVGGIDIRTVGSGNVGATNVARSLGTKWFFVVFALDAGKGVLPVLLFPRLAGSPDSALLAVGCGFAAILGHVFNPFLHFKGGKGVATTAGVLAALAPLPAAVAFGVFVAVFAIFRWVSLASVCAAAALPPIAFAFGLRPEVVVFTVLAAVVVVVKHRSNLARIAAGTEPRAFVKKEASHG